MEGNALFEELENDLRKTLMPPAGKSDRGFIPPEILKAIIEKVVVTIVAGLLAKAGAAIGDWWKGRKQQLDGIQGRPTAELAAEAAPILEGTKAQLAAELSKLPQRQLPPPDRGQLVGDIRVVLIEFHFSDTEADRVAKDMAEAVAARLTRAELS
jgi:hypothetical protein